MVDASCSNPPSFAGIPCFVVIHVKSRFLLVLIPDFDEELTGLTGLVLVTSAEGPVEMIPLSCYTITICGVSILRNLKEF